MLSVMVFRNLQRNELLFACLRLSPGVNCTEKRSSGSHMANSQDIPLHDVGQSFSELKLAKQQCLCHCEVEVVSGE